MVDLGVVEGKWCLSAPLELQNWNLTSSHMFRVILSARTARFEIK